MPVKLTYREYNGNFFFVTHFAVQSDLFTFLNEKIDSTQL